MLVHRQLDLEKEKLQKANSQAWGMSRVDRCSRGGPAMCADQRSPQRGGQQQLRQILEHRRSSRAQEATTILGSCLALK